MKVTTYMVVFVFVDLIISFCHHPAHVASLRNAFFYCSLYSVELCWANKNFPLAIFMQHLTSGKVNEIYLQRIIYLISDLIFDIFSCRT